MIYDDSPCPAGHYCPLGTASEYENPCPRGTFFNSTRAESLDDCLACTPGYYCDIDGLENPTGLCDPGMGVMLSNCIIFSDILRSLIQPCLIGIYVEGNSVPSDFVFACQYHSDKFLEVNMLVHVRCT